MTLNKKSTVREIGRRTRLRNHDIQRMLETLIEVWSEELATGGRIEIQDFLVLEVQQIDRGLQQGTLRSGPSRRIIHRLMVRPSNHLREKLRRIKTHPKPG